MAKYGTISVREETSHGNPVAAVKVMDHEQRQVREIIVPRIDATTRATVRECAMELLNEAHRINQMRFDGLTLSPEYVINLLLKIGNELNETIKEAR